MNFHIYENGKATKGVYDTFAEAKVGAKLYMDGSPELEIHTVNSPAPVVVWIYDYEIEQWVEQKKA